MKQSRWRLIALAVGGGALLLLFALAEGDLPEALGDIANAVRDRVAGLGPAASFGALYLEESGIPSPLPGDIFVLYLGKASGGRPLTMLLYWLGVILTVVLGATNLYLLSRFLGHRLLQGWLGRLLHITPERLARAEDWFARYGALTIIFGRHVPGFRIPITVAAGVLRVDYRVFAPSVTVSSAIWAGIWIVLGARYGSRLTSFLNLHRSTYLLLPAALLVFIALLILRRRRANRRLKQREPTEES